VIDRRIGNHERPLVSVIIPVYNGAAFIADAIQSAARQTYRNLEIIVVDDGSTDDTLAILDRHAAADSRIRILTQANSGVAAARNRAIAEAHGEFIAPLDADDLWLPEKIARQLNTLLAAGDDCGFVYCWWAWIDEAASVLDRSPRWRIAGHKLPELILINFTGNASVPLFRKRALEEAGGYNSALAAANAGGCEDWEVVLRVAARYRIAVVEDVLLGYRRRPDSMSQACDTMWRSHRLVMKGTRELRPELVPALFQGSENQFAMYLAGVSFWSGNLRQAIRWGLRAGFRLPVLVFPWVVKMMVFRGRFRKRTLTMQPGVALDTALIPNPLLPYDVVLSPGQFPVRFFRFVTGPFWVVPRILREFVHTCMHHALLWRMRREAEQSNTLKAGAHKPRVLATACWHFPIYSQTFVYRELLALVDAEFEVRFAYAGLQPRTNLPDDLTRLWEYKRRIIYAENTSRHDLEYFQAILPEKFERILRTVSRASGLAPNDLIHHKHFKQAFTFARFAEAWQPDYIHTYFFYEQALFGFVASELLGIPRGVSCYADHMMDDFDLKLVKLHAETCDVIVATSVRIKRELEEIAGHDLPAAIVKPNGIDAARFASPERLPAAGRILRGVAVNRIHPKKGVSFLVEAVLLLREREIPFRLDILGEFDTHDPDGPRYFEQLQLFVATHNLGDSVHFRGRQSAPQVRQWLAETDIFLAPFIELANGDKDGIPTALLEAMAAGCAIVASDAGSMTEVFDDGVEGLMVPQSDARALAEAIALLVTDEQLRTQIAHAAVARVRRQFDVDVCEPLFHERIRAVLGRKPKPVADEAPAPLRIQRAPDFKPLKIALLSYEYPPETGFGGIGTYTWYHARALVRLGHQVHVLAGATRAHALRTYTHDGVTVHRYRAAGPFMLFAALFGWRNCYWTQRRLENTWCMFRGLRLLRRHHSFDLVEAPECGADASFITLFSRIPTVVRFHGPASFIMPFYDVPQADIAMCSWVEQLALDHATALTSCSDYVAREARALLGVKAPISVIANGIDVPLFDQEPPADIHAQYNIQEGQTTILFAGRMERRKGIHLCAEIVESILSRRDVTFLFAGEDLFGYVETTLKPALAGQKLLGSFRYLGKLGLADLRALSRAVDIYLLPSQWENCPYACLEAMAAGRAIVCSDQGGMPELIQDGVNGLLATHDSAQAYVNQLERMIDEPHFRRRMGEAARQSVELYFTDLSTAHTTEVVYEACIQRCRRKE
jgi:glycosyltransferase involved in cell wall biosynthesis